MEDEGEWQLLFPFDDPSASYVHGFEAGMIWQRMQAGEEEIVVTVHRENEITLRRMADAAGYEMTYAETEMLEWADVTFQRRPRRGPMNVVK